LSRLAVQTPPFTPRKSWLSVRITPLHDGVNLDRAIVCPLEEDPPGADPTAQT